MRKKVTARKPAPKATAPVESATERNVGSLPRAFAILRELVQAQAEGARVTQSAKQQGLTQATVHRLLQSLIAEGMVEQDERSKLYRLSLGFFALAARAGEAMNLLSLVLVNLGRNKKRTVLTMLSVIVALFLFCTLSGVLDTLAASIEVGSESRLVTRNKISLIFPIPLAYRTRIEAA